MSAQSSFFLQEKKKLIISLRIVGQDPKPCPVTGKPRGSDGRDVGRLRLAQEMFWPVAIKQMKLLFFSCRKAQFLNVVHFYMVSVGTVYEFNWLANH